MSSGIYALLGVLLGGLVTAGLSWWQGWRAAQTEWQVVSRLITDELEQMMSDLAGFVSLSSVPTGFRDDLLSSALWEEHRAVVARGIKNDLQGDEFWRGLSRLYAQVRAFRWWLGVATPGSEIADSEREHARRYLATAARAYESLTGVAPDMELPPPVHSPTE